MKTRGDSSNIVLDGAPIPHLFDAAFSKLFLHNFDILSTVKAEVYRNEVAFAGAFDAI